MELPQTFRKPLEYISRNVLFDQTRPFIPENDTLMPHGKEIHHVANGQINVSSKGVAGMSCENKGWFAVVIVDISVVHPVHVYKDVLFFITDKRVLSSLQLQMSLYFNTWFFPVWWISESVMLHVKVKTKRCKPGYAKRHSRQTFK